MNKKYNLIGKLKQPRKLFGLSIAIFIYCVFIVHASAITYNYDSLNRLTNADYGNGFVISYTYDAAGNRLTYSCPGNNDTTAPTIAIISPTSGSSYTTASSSISLSGTASDNVGVVLVNWVNDRGGMGRASGTNNWSISNLRLKTGYNNITVNAYDAAGNNSSAYLTVIYAPGAATTNTVFSDNFIGNVINSSVWSWWGSTVNQSNGTMEVMTTVTDQPGTLTNKPFAISSTGFITISRRVLLHLDTPQSFNGGTHFFTGVFAINVPGVPQFGVQYCDYDYSNSSLKPAYGFFIFRNGASATSIASQSDVSTGITAIWDTWFNEKITYDPATGQLQYYVNDALQITFNVGAVPATPPPTMSFYFQAYGWWTTHYQWFQNLLVTQVTSGGASSITSTISTVNSPAFGGTATGGGTITNGTYQTLTAIPNQGYAFVNWTEGGAIVSSTTSYGFTVSTNRTLTANYLDAIHPTNNITAPTPGQLWSNAQFTVTGKASDNASVANVYYSLNYGTWTVAQQTAGSWSNWTAQVSLNAGTNNIQAYAVDPSGNTSATNSVNVVCYLSAPLTVTTNGLGSLSPNYGGASLQIGKSYSITATAGTGFVFTNWTGGTNLSLNLLTNGTTVSFSMVSNLTLQANFVDTQKPVLSITNLTAGQRWSNLVFSVKGTATDNWQVASVQVQLNGGIWTNATGTTNWSAPLTLTPGTNTLAAYATDTTGNKSPTNSVSWQYVVTNLLTVQATGLGTISPNYSNAWLEIGRNYSMTAAPATGFVVTNWTISTNWLGGRVTNNVTVQFMMASNLTLQVNFADVTKPTVSITAPTAGQKMTNALATFVGTASDNWKVAGVWYQLNSNAWHLVTATTNSYTNWTQTLPLRTGTNTLNAYAVDLGGNVSTVSTLSVISSNTFLLQLAFTNMLPLTKSGLAFSLQSTMGLNGHIQVSTDLIVWTNLASFIGSNSTIFFRDPAATNSVRRFYRAVTP